MLVSFLRKKQIGENVWEFFFAPEQPLEYLPGQYVDVTIPDVQQDARGRSRTFSLTSLPNDNFISFATFFPENSSPFKIKLSSLKPGKQIHVSDAMGDLVLPRLQTQPLIFVAGGLGVASFVSALRYCKESSLPHPVTLLWALRNEADKVQFPILDTFSFAHRADYIAPERLEVAKILEHAGQTGMVYVSGSQNFTESLVAELRAQRHPDTRLAFDYFTGYQDL